MLLHLEWPHRGKWGTEVSDWERSVLTLPYYMRNTMGAKKNDYATPQLLPIIEY